MTPTTPRYRPPPARDIDPTADGRTTGRILVVLDPDDPEESLRWALETAALDGAVCDLLLVYPAAVYNARRRARHDAHVSGEYTFDHLVDDARRRAHHTGTRWLTGQAFEATGAVGRTSDAVADALRRADYDHVVFPRDHRSLLTRLLDGDPIGDALRWRRPPHVEAVPRTRARDPR